MVLSVLASTFSLAPTDLLGTHKSATLENPIGDASRPWHWRIRLLHKSASESWNTV